MIKQKKEKSSILKQKQFGILKKIIDKHDPIDLLQIGAPQDEYVGEVKSILRRLKKGMQPEDIDGIVFEVFVRCFSEAIIRARGREKKLKKIAREIINIKLL